MGHPELRPHHLRDARLFADRRDLLKHIGCRKGGIVAEVGVALGDFSQVILDELQPKIFVAIDTFAMHEWPLHWGRTSKEIFGTATHEQFYRRRFAERGNQVSVLAGLSAEVLAGFDDHSFDMIYVDAAHDYHSVSIDARLSAAKLLPDGILIFNDYIMFDHALNAAYGVVQAVNELVVDGPWKVIGFALQQEMFCDIALARA